MADTLTYEKLRDYTAGEAEALRAKIALQPAGGKGDKVFPSTFGPPQNERWGVKHRYATEKVADEEGNETVNVLLDSVASQANRAEMALLELHDSCKIDMPVPYVDFSACATEDENIRNLPPLTALEASHRISDAVFRDSLLAGEHFRKHEIGKAITSASPRNATALFQHCPTVLLFGYWDSTGGISPEKACKIQRAYVSEVVGLGANIGVATSSRIDPLHIPAGITIYEHANPDIGQTWTLHPDKAAKDKNGKPKTKGDGKPSNINHSNVAPSINIENGGVRISEAVQTTVISLAALRKLGFGNDTSREAVLAMQTAIAALGVLSMVAVYEGGMDLRSRCLLIPEDDLAIEAVFRGKKESEVFSVTKEDALSLLAEADKQAIEAGHGWSRRDDSLVFTPSPELIQLMEKSAKHSDASGD